MSHLDKDIFLRVLKGAPLSVLLSLWVFGAMDRKGIMARTGWKKGSVDDALVFLEGLGLVVRPHYRIWALTDGFYQLPLPMAESPQNRLSGSYAQDSESPENGTSESYPQAESPQNGTSGAEGPENGLSDLSSSGSRSTTSNEVTLPLAPPQGGKPDEAIVAACCEVGIYGKKRRRLATLPHVVAAGPDYVRGHVAAAGSVRLAIWRMEEQWDVPKSAQVRDLTNQIPKEYEDVVIR